MKTNSKQIRDLNTLKKKKIRRATKAVETVDCYFSDPGLCKAFLNKKAEEERIKENICVLGFINIFIKNPLTIGAAEWLSWLNI